MIRDALWDYPEILLPFLRHYRIVFVILLGLLFGAGAIFLIQQVSIVQASQVFQENRFIEGYVGDDLRINPIIAAQSNQDRDVTQLVYSSLVKVTTTGEMVPELAETWSISTDGKSYTMYLRKGVKWHDGYEFTAKDVVTTFELIKLAGEKVPNGQILQNVVVTAPDSYTVQFKLPQANAAFLELLMFGILPDHIFNGYTYTKFADESQDMIPIGTGPYKYVEQKGNSYLFKANAQYFFKKPNISEFEVKRYDTMDDAVAALRKAEIYSLPNLDAKYLPTLAGYKSINVDKYVLSQNTRILYFNVTSESPTLSRPVRRAFAQAVDKVDLAQLVAGAEPAYGPYAPNSWAYNPDVESYLSTDITAAAFTLGQDGWTLQPGDQVRYKNNVPLTFSITYLDNDTNKTVVEQLKMYGAQIGMRITGTPVSRDDLIQRILPERDFEALLFEAQTSIDPDLYTMWHSSQIKFPGLNISGYKSNEMDGLLEKGRTITDRSRRKTNYDDFQKNLINESAAIFLYHPPLYVATFDIIKRPTKTDDFLLPGERLLTFPEWKIEPRWRNWQTR